MEPDDLLHKPGRSPTPPPTGRPRIAPLASSPRPGEPGALEAKPGPTVRLEKLRAFYGAAEPLKGIDLEFRANEVTAIIGPSGCGKSTLVRCINRMHEEIPGAHAEGRVLLDGLDVYDSSVDVVAVRRAIGMVFQKPNPFPTMSIFDNVAAGLRLSSEGRHGRSKEALGAKGESTLRAAGSWEQCARLLADPPAGLPGAQNQRV